MCLYVLPYAFGDRTGRERVQPVQACLPIDSTKLETPAGNIREPPVFTMKKTAQKKYGNTFSSKNLNTNRAQRIEA